MADQQRRGSSGGKDFAGRQVNSEGAKLIIFCEEVGGIIRDGHTKGDWEGKITHLGERQGEGGSVID